jgi:putative spermidine/putrescine transport system ATP-binding protein
MEALRQATAAAFVKGSRVTPAADQAEGGRVASVRLEGLSKQYGTFDAVRDVSLDVRNGEFLTLLGPSGSGKTTTLMMIAGFVTPSSGRILVDGRDVTDEPPHRRNIGMVYQSYALFPHLTVFKNVAFPLEVRKCPPSEIRQRATEALEIVKLADLGDRYPAQLSGGQQQRVALARAIVFRPPLLLMDEPLGALDRKLREHMQIELMKIQSRLGITVVYVTHDQEEALVMSNRVAVMADGTLQQVGSPEELYQRPANRFVADFVGETNLIDGRILVSGSAASVLVAPGFEVHAHSDRQWTKGDDVCVVVRPECVRIGTTAQGCVNRLDGIVERVIYIGDVSRFMVTLPSGQTLVVKVQNGGQAHAANVGERITLGWSAESSWLVARSQGDSQPPLQTV